MQDGQGYKMITVDCCGTAEGRVVTWDMVQPALTDKAVSLGLGSLVDVNAIRSIKVVVKAGEVAMAHIECYGKRDDVVARLTGEVAEAEVTSGDAKMISTYVVRCPISDLRFDCFGPYKANPSVLGIDRDVYDRTIAFHNALIEAVEGVTDRDVIMQRLKEVKARFHPKAERHDAATVFQVPPA